jgi:hypothetical protein
MRAAGVGSWGNGSPTWTLACKLGHVIFLFLTVSGAAGVGAQLTDERGRSGSERGDPAD